VVILGLGNVLLQDDGVGVRAVERLAAEYAIPDGVEVLDGGTLGMSLLPRLAGADAAILVDAVRADAPAGTLVELSGDDVGPAVQTRLSPHQVGVADLLDGLRWLGETPPRLRLIGLVPEQMELGLELSPAVEKNLGSLVDAVALEAQSLGHELVRTPS
jgi:hydrogenase maturation protease